VLRRFNFPSVPIIQPPLGNETNPRNPRPRAPYLGRLSQSQHQSTQSRFMNASNEVEDTGSRFNLPSVIPYPQRGSFGNEWSLSLSWLNQAALGESYLSSASASEASRSIRNSALSEEEEGSRLEFGGDGGSYAASPYDRVPDNRNSTGFSASLRTSGDWSFDQDVRSILSVPISEVPPPLLRQPNPAFRQP
jgi:hypothetical protein